MFFNDNCIPTPIFSYVAPIALVNSVQKCLVLLNYFYKNCYHSGLSCTVFCNPLTPNSARQFMVETGLILSLYLVHLNVCTLCLYSVILLPQILPVSFWLKVVLLSLYLVHLNVCLYSMFLLILTCCRSFSTVSPRCS